MIKRNCPNCERETTDEHETICIVCGHGTREYLPKKETSFKKKAVGKKGVANVEPIKESPDKD